MTTNEWVTTEDWLAAAYGALLIGTKTGEFPAGVPSLLDGIRAHLVQRGIKVRSAEEIL